VALIFVGESGENAIAVAGGANDRLMPAHVARAQAFFGPTDVALLQLETPLATVTRAVALARRRGARVILNPAPAARLPDELLAKVDVLTPNEHEARLLTGISAATERGARKAARALRARGVATVIVTLGAQGALLADEAGERVIPGFPVRAVDTTAAGDVFNGVLAVRLADGCNLDDAIRFAHAAAALSVTRKGAQPSIPRRRAVLAFLRNLQSNTP
jgi:ribokinase